MNRLVQRILMVAEIGGDADQAVDDDPVVGGDRFEARLRRAGEQRIERGLLDRVAAVPGVAVAGRRDHADAGAPTSIDVPP
jgi:hypothetical protein